MCMITSKKIFLTMYNKNSFYLKWNDLDLNINWPVKSPIMSTKDRYNCMKFNELNIFKNEITKA